MPSTMNSYYDVAFEALQDVSNFLSSIINSCMAVVVGPTPPSMDIVGPTGCGQVVTIRGEY
jgi:hypothetical protein